MFREEIIKALECCSAEISTDLNCGKCPMSGKTDCMTFVYKESLTLIRELIEEIERLKKTRYMAYPDGRLEMIPSIESVRADTVREMQERLKDHLEKPEFPWDCYTVSAEVVDRIAEEMLEER